MAKYYVWDPDQRLYVGCIRNSRKKAEYDVQDFGKQCVLLTQTEARGPFNNDEDDLFWRNHTQFGVKYRCKVCKRDRLGKGPHNHSQHCPLYKSNLVPAPKCSRSRACLPRDPEERVAPAQESLTDQMRRVISWANRSGLYDAADWITANWKRTS